MRRAANFARYVRSRARKPLPFRARFLDTLEMRYILQLVTPNTAIAIVLIVPLERMRRGEVGVVVSDRTSRLCKEH